MSVLKTSIRMTLLAAMSAPAWLSGIAQACESYGPAPAALTGILTSLQASGPPGYGATPKTDSIVQVPIVQIEPPICVNAVPANPANVAEKDVNTVQLLHNQPIPPELMGLKVVVSGTLAHASSPDHRTPVVIQAKGIEKMLTSVDTVSPP